MPWPLDGAIAESIDGATDWPPRSIQSSSGIGVMVASPAGLMAKWWRFISPLAAWSGGSPFPCAQAQTAMRETEIKTSTRFIHPPLAFSAGRERQTRCHGEWARKYLISLEEADGRGSGTNPLAAPGMVRNCAAALLVTHLLHLLAEAERPHVGPDLFDVREALRLRTVLAGVSPTQRQLFGGRPDGVLLLVVDHDHVDRLVVVFVVVHVELMVLRFRNITCCVCRLAARRFSRKDLRIHAGQ